jgi:hypothetical protein
MKTLALSVSVLAVVFNDVCADSVQCRVVGYAAVNTEFQTTRLKATVD